MKSLHVVARQRHSLKYYYSFQSLQLLNDILRFWTGFVDFAVIFNCVIRKQNDLCRYQNESPKAIIRFRKILTGSICTNRSKTALTPVSGLIPVQIAPILVAASIAITVFS